MLESEHQHRVVGDDLDGDPEQHEESAGEMREARDRERRLAFGGEEDALVERRVHEVREQHADVGGHDHQVEGARLAADGDGLAGEDREAQRVPDDAHQNDCRVDEEDDDP